MRKGDGKYYTQTVHIMDGDASISTTKNSNGNWYFRKWLDDEKRMYERSLRTKDLDTARDRAKKEYIDLMSDRSKGRSVVALAKQMSKPNTKTVTRTVSIPKTKVIKQPVQQPSKPEANDTVRTAIKPVTPHKPLPNQQIN